MIGSEDDGEDILKRVRLVSIYIDIRGSERRKLLKTVYKSNAYNFMRKT